MSSDDLPQHSNTKRRKICRNTSSRKTEESDDSHSPRRSSASGNEQCGIIRRVILKNLFCHEHLDFEGFTPGINLLQGANGSGKSSIVAAIVAGLGGSSKATDRAQNLKSLIQEGKQWASIEIHLKNDGCNTYKKETFGKTIIVERKLQLSGSSSYKIKSAQGQIISTKKDDLNKILDRFNFQVDNPVLILTQERAKTFLSTTDEKTLFKFFVTSTQVKQWSCSIDDVSKIIETSNMTVARKRDNISNLVKDIKVWKEKLHAINSLATNRERVTYLTRAKEWAEVEEEEEELKKYKKEEQKVQKQLEELVKFLKNNEAKKRELTNKDSSSNKNFINLAKMIEDLKVLRETTKNELNEANAKLRSKVNEKKELEKEKLEKERDISALREKLEKDNNEASAQWEAVNAHLNIEKERVQTSMSEIKERKQTEEAQIRNLINTLEKEKSDYHHFVLEQKGLEMRLRTLKKDLTEIKEQTDNITVFGQFMPHVMKEINNATSKRQFRDKPIGPIGSYIKVKDNDWIHVVEKVTRGLLSSFLVSCRQDYDSLSKIFFRTIPKGAPRPQVIVSPFRDKIHDFNRLETRTSKYFSMWSIIETDNIHVANVLLDQLQVESLLLVPKAVEAMNFLENENTVPRNCKKAMTLHGDTIIPAPDYRIYSGNGDRSVKFLQVSVEDKIRDLELSIRNTTIEIHGSEAEISDKKNSLSVLEKERKGSEEKLRSYQRALGQCEKKLQDLKNDEIPPPPNVNVLQKDLEENEKKKMEIEEKLDEVCTQFEEWKKEKDIADKNFREAQIKSEKITTEAQTYQSNSSRIQEQLKENKKEFIAYTNKEKEMENKRNDILKTLEEKQSRIKKMVDQLIANEENGERISLNKSKKEIEKEITALKTVIQEKEASYGNLRVVNDTLNAKVEKFNNIKSDIKSHVDYIAMMRNTLNSRLSLMKQTKKLHQILVRTSFISMIEKRKLKGKLDINYKMETLSINLTKDTGRSADDTLQSLQMMSGGERSFVTVSFILALWDIVSSPIRIMDEFDIFMDVVSRKQCMDMIVESVKDSCQYIMVSPLEYRVTSDRLNFFKLEAPKRKDVEEKKRSLEI